MGRRVTRAAFARASGICIPTLKQIECRGVTPHPATLAKIEALQKLIGADLQAELLDGLSAERDRREEAERDRLLDKMMRRAKPLKKTARQAGLFTS